MFSKSRTIKLDCYTYRQDVYEYAKPAPSKHFIPEWWKSLPGIVQEPNKFAPSSTMKYCRGFIDQYAYGFIVPMWTDLLFEALPNGQPGHRWEFADGISQGIPHPQLQRGEFFDEKEFSHLKLMVPWVFECSDSKLQWTLQQPIWNMKALPYVIPNGMVTFEHQRSCHVNFFALKKHVANKFTIHAGHPLIQAIPLSMNDLEIRCHVVSREEYDRKSFTSMQTTFVKKYAAHAKLAELNKERTS